MLVDKLLIIGVFVFDMTTMELEAYKAELAREILMSDSRELLDKVKRLLRKEAKAEEQIKPYTLEELNARIDEAEAEIEAGEVLTCEEQK